MRPNGALISAVLAAGTVRRAQTAQEKKIPAGCKRTHEQLGSPALGPFEFLPNETFKGHPVVRFLIHEDGTISDVKLVRGSGVRDINERVLESVSRWQYKPNLECGVVEVEKLVIIDFILPIY